MPLRSSIAASAALLFAGLASSSVEANTLYLSATGTATTGCSATAPCQYFAAAINAANPGDTIVCLSPPQSGPMASITKSLTIDCLGTGATVRDGGIPGSGGASVGMLINIAVSAGDPLRTVRLRGLTIDGASGVSFISPGGRIMDRGLEIQAAAAVYIENCVIANVNQAGIYDSRTAEQTRLFVSDTIVSNNGGVGIAVGSPSGVVVLDNVRSLNNSYGFATSAGNKVTINRSVFSGNSSVGVEGDISAQIIVNASVMSNNSVGVESNASVRLSNNDIAYNGTAISGASGSLGNNRFSGNGAAGTAPATIPGAPANVGP